MSDAGVAGGGPRVAGVGIVDLNGVYVSMRACVDASASVMDALVAHMRERAAAEEAHAKALSKLSKAGLPGLDRAVHPALAGSLTALLADERNAAVQHAATAESIGRDVITPLLEVRSSVCDGSESVTGEAKRATRVVRAAYEGCKRAYNRYVALHRRAVEMCAGAGMTPPQLWDPTAVATGHSTAASTPVLTASEGPPRASPGGVPASAPTAPGSSRSPLDATARVLAARDGAYGSGVPPAPLPPPALEPSPASLPPLHRRVSHARAASASAHMRTAPVATAADGSAPDTEEVHGAIGSGKAPASPAPDADDTAAAAPPAIRLSRRGSGSILGPGLQQIGAIARSRGSSVSSDGGVGGSEDAARARAGHRNAASMPSSVMTELTVADALRSDAAAAVPAPSHVNVVGAEKSAPAVDAAVAVGMPSSEALADADTPGATRTGIDDSFNESISTGISGIPSAVAGDGDTASDSGSMASSVTDGALVQALSGRWKAMASSFLNFSFTGSPTAAYMAGTANLSTAERIEQLRQAATQACAAAEAARKECQDAWDAHNKATVAFSGQLLAALTIFRELEKRRAAEMSDALRKYAVFVSSALANMQYDVNHLATTVEEAGTAALAEDAISPAMRSALAMLPGTISELSAASIAAAPARRPSNTVHAASSSGTSLRRIALETAASKAAPSTPIARGPGSVESSHRSSASLDMTGSGSTLPGASLDEVLEHSRQARSGSMGMREPHDGQTGAVGGTMGSPESTAGSGITRFWRFGRGGKPSDPPTVSINGHAPHTPSPLAPRSEAGASARSDGTVHVAVSPSSAAAAGSPLRSFFSFGSGKSPASSAPASTTADASSATSSHGVTAPPPPPSGFMQRLRLGASPKDVALASHVAAAPPLDPRDIAAVDAFVRALFDPHATLPTLPEEGTEDEEIPSLTLAAFAAGSVPPPRSRGRTGTDGSTSLDAAAATSIHPELHVRANFVVAALQARAGVLSQLTSAMDARRSEANALSAGAFEVLVTVLWHALDAAAAFHDFSSARVIMVMSQAFFVRVRPEGVEHAPSSSNAPASEHSEKAATPPKGSVRVYAQARLSSHTLWRAPAFWEDCLAYALSQPAPAPSSKSGRFRGDGKQREVAFAQLGLLAYNMSAFGVPSEDIRQLFQRHAKTMKLSESETTQLNTSIEMFTAEHARERSGTDHK